MPQEYGFDPRYDAVTDFIRSRALDVRHRFPMVHVFHDNARVIAEHLLSAGVVDHRTGMYNGEPIANVELVQTDSSVHVSVPRESKGNYKLILSNEGAPGNTYVNLQMIPEFPPRRLEWLDLADAVCVMRFPHSLLKLPV